MGRLSAYLPVSAVNCLLQPGRKLMGKNFKEQQLKEQTGNWKAGMNDKLLINQQASILGAGNINIRSEKIPPPKELTEYQGELRSGLRTSQTRAQVPPLTHSDYGTLGKAGLLTEK